MSELLIVRFADCKLEDLPILRHCWNLQHLEVETWFWPSLLSFPVINADSESVGVIDFRYLTALCVFSVKMVVEWIAVGVSHSFRIPEYSLDVSK